MIVAIHQPNYLPWLGYFYKIAKSDVFIFLDDVQFSKNSYINRVQVLSPGGPKWLTVPVSYHFGDPINMVRPANDDWPTRHLDTLLNYSRSAPCFRAVWPHVQEMYRGIAGSDLATINRHLVEGIAGALGITCEFTLSSAFPVAGLTSDDRLTALVSAVDSQGTYLSGRGGEGYQDTEKFNDAGLGFRYTDFQHPSYEQRGGQFIEGLSVLDAVFNLGWAGVAELIIEKSGQ